MIEVRYDQEADALYLTLLRGVRVLRTEVVDERTLVDLTDDGRVAGIEIIHPARGWALNAVLESFRVASEDAATLRQLSGSPTVA